MTDVLATTRCPQCVGLVRPGQQWCTLCHADLRPAPEPARVEPPAADLSSTGPVPDPTAYDPLTSPLVAAAPDIAPDAAPAAPAAGGKHARHAAPAAAETGGAADGVDRAVLGEREIEAMIAELAAQTQPPLGGIASRLDSRGAKVVLAVAVCLGALSFLLLGTVVLTAIFG